MKRISQHLPVEAYTIFLPTILFLIYISVYTFSCGNVCDMRFWQGNFVSTLLTFTFLSSFFLPILLFSALVFVLTARTQNKHANMQLMYSFLFLLGTIVTVSVIIDTPTILLFNTVNPLRVATASAILTRTDYMLFGTYPWLALHSFITSKLLETFIFQSYLVTGFVGGFLAVILALCSTRSFRKFVLAFFFAYMIGIVFWIAIPAISPDAMYRAHILNTPIPQSIQEQLSATHFSPLSKKTMGDIQDRWTDPESQSFAVSTFPSMHAAWGIVIAVIAIELWAPLAIVFIPYVFFELVGTVFTLQHYAVDTLFGIMVGFVALWLAERLLQYEEKCFLNRHDIFSSYRHVQEYVRSVWKRLYKIPGVVYRNIHKI